MSIAPQHRNTIQRRIILEELRKLKGHPSAAELYAIARKRLPKISLGTVYRNLELLAQMGLIRKFTLACGEYRFDGITAPHQHVQCKCCGQVDDVEGSLSIHINEESTDFRGYRILSHQTVFFGICPKCQQSFMKPVTLSLWPAMP